MIMSRPYDIGYNPSECWWLGYRVYAYLVIQTPFVLIGRLFFRNLRLYRFVQSEGEGKGSLT